MEGVFLDRTDQGLKPRFLKGEPPSDADVAHVVQKSRRRVIHKLRRLGYLEAEIKEKGAHAMVTPCPLCHLNLDGNQPRAAAQKGTDIDLPILHMPQMLGLAMGFSPEEMGLKRHIVSTRQLSKQVTMLS
jgi:heterodisulfide reductase subunit B